MLEDTIIGYEYEYDTQGIYLDVNEVNSRKYHRSRVKLGTLTLCVHIFLDYLSHLLRLKA